MSIRTISETLERPGDLRLDLGIAGHALSTRPILLHGMTSKLHRFARELHKKHKKQRSFALKLCKKERELRRFIQKLCKKERKLSSFALKLHKKERKLRKKGSKMRSFGPDPGPYFLFQDRKPAAHCNLQRYWAKSCTVSGSASDRIAATSGHRLSPPLFGAIAARNAIGIAVR